MKYEKQTRNCDLLMGVNMGKGFTKEHTWIVKGVLIIFLLFHHLFYGENIETHHIQISINNLEIYKNFVIYGRVCISGFAFLSAYGLTCKIKSVEKKSSFWFDISVKQFIKLESSCCFIYIAAVFYKHFIAQQSVRQLYFDVKGMFRPVYMIIDCLGLANFMGTPTINVTWWYLSFAILLIFVVPVFYMIYEKIGFLAFPVVIILFPHKLLGIVLLGVVFSLENWFERLEKFSQTKKGIIICALSCLMLLYISYEIVAGTQTIDYVQMWVGALWAFMGKEYLSRIPVLRNILKMLGKYSANIFMIHTFVYYYFYESFIYSFKKDYMILGILFLISLILSIIVELMKKIIRYNFIIEKCTNWCLLHVGKLRREL